MAGQDEDEAGAARQALALDRQLCFSLYSAVSLITRRYRPLLQPLGLTYPQYLAMLALWERSPRSVGEIGERLGLDSGTLTPLFKRMETAGLVDRLRDPADERRVLVRLTDKGLALKARAAAVPAAMARQLPGSIEDLVLLKASVDRLVNGLQREES
jgi:DNA-binding MarR family transcriptional regulator